MRRIVLCGMVCGWFDGRWYIYYTMFEGLHSRIEEGRLKYLIPTISGFVAASTSAILTNPLDIAKTRIQVCCLFWLMVDANDTWW